MAYTIHEFGGFSWPLAILGLLGFSGFANLHIPLSMLLWLGIKKLFEPGRRMLYLLFPVCMGLGKITYPMIFEWNFGYSWFYGSWPAMQTAELWGFQFLHTLTLFFNLLVFAIIKIVSKTGYKNKTAWGMACGGLLLFLVLNAGGVFLKYRLPEANQTATALILQPNIDNNAHLKIPGNYNRKIFHKLTNQTTAGLDVYKGEEPIDFIIWPEGTYPYHIKRRPRKGRESHTTLSLKEYIRKWNTPLILNAKGVSGKGRTNSVFSFDSKGRLFQPPYDKVKLLIFGEYLPAESFLKKILPYFYTSFLKGDGQHSTVSLASGTVLGLQICYEGLFDGLNRTLSQKKPQVIVNVTNDGWYDKWIQPRQHFYMTLARALELRVPMLRVTNTGISGLISHKGEILFLSQVGKAQTWVKDIPVMSQDQTIPSLFKSWGYYINPIVLYSLLLFIMIWMVIKKLTGNTVT